MEAAIPKDEPDAQRHSWYPPSYEGEAVLYHTPYVFIRLSRNNQKVEKFLCTNDPNFEGWRQELKMHRALKDKKLQGVCKMELGSRRAVKSGVGHIKFTFPYLPYSIMNVKLSNKYAVPAVHSGLLKIYRVAIQKEPHSDLTLSMEWALRKLRTAQLLADMVACVARLHNCGLAHGNLTPDRFRFSELDAQPQLLSLKYASKIIPGQKIIMDVPKHPYCTAPEVLSGEKVFPDKADIWSLGIIFYLLIADRYPFGDINKAQLHTNRKELEWCINNVKVDFSFVSNTSYAKLLALMLDRNPVRRGSAEKVLTMLQSLINRGLDDTNVRQMVFPHGVHLRM